MTAAISFPHPGETIRHDYLEPLGLSGNALAAALGVRPMRISLILRGQRAITADTALRLARYFTTTPQFWLNLQAEYDLRQAERTVGRTVERVVHPREEATVPAHGRSHRRFAGGAARRR
jgi:addiction module HigA family antidote